MDNLTHTVIGCIAGAALARVRPGAAHRLRLPAIGMIGGNLPDLDLLWSYRGRGTDLGQLTYLLEHRGYTHTLLGCLALGVLLYGAVVLVARRAAGPLARGEHALLLAGSVGATLLHLAMDALNTYGVHPFWPFDNRWIYGDSIFIVEPLYWAAAAPLLFVFVSRGARALIGALLVAGIALSAASGLVPPLGVALLVAVSAAGLLAGRTLGAGRAAAVSLGLCVATGAAFALAGQGARQRVQQAAARDFPDEHLIDTVVSPMPADPLCWDALVLGVAQDRYQAHRVTVTLAPGLLPAAACRDRDLRGRTTVHWESPGGASLPWTNHSLSLPDLRALVQGHCQAAALMQFVRAPFLAREADAQVLGDLRYDREGGRGFAKLAFPRPGAEICPAPAPWTPPRADLLGVP